MNQFENKTPSSPRTKEETPLTFATPAVDVYESDHGCLVRADLPGVKKDGLTLRFEDDRLFIEGRAEDNQHVLRRSFGLRDQVDPEAIAAKLEDGVLEVQLPKAERARPREIQVA